MQPVTGWALAALIGYSMFDSWIMASLVLYVLVGLCWLPVVGIQIKLRDLAAEAARKARRCRRAITRCFGSGSGSAGRPSSA